jgi:hypothetical protein
MRRFSKISHCWTKSCRPGCIRRAMSGGWLQREARQACEPLPANASAHRKDVIRGYRRELSRIGVLSAKTEAEARNRLVDRQSERPKAIDSEIIEGTGAAPPGAPSPSATRTADLTAPRPEGGVFDSKRANDRTPVAEVLQTDTAADRQLVSGLGGPASLVPRGSLGFDIVTRTHVEGHAAAPMRQLGIRRGTVYINNPAICSSCERLLPLMLPSGVTLRVVLPSGVVVIFVGTAP